MTLHRNPDLFRNAILLTAAAQGLSQGLIEKDYWVTWVLRNLTNSSLASEVVFKGGTSLSKAYRLVDRFSEDVDLAGLLAGRAPAAVKVLLRDVQQSPSARRRCPAMVSGPDSARLPSLPAAI